MFTFLFGHVYVKFKFRRSYIPNQADVWSNGGEGRREGNEGPSNVPFILYVYYYFVSPYMILWFSFYV